MEGHEGGRWDVAVKDDAVYVQRVSDDDKQLFEDSLASDEARQLAELLTKFADKADESDAHDDSADSDDEPDDSDEDGDSEEDDDSADDESEDSQDSEDSDN